MELVLLTIIFCIIGMMLCMGLGYIAGTISVEDAKKDVTDDELAAILRTIKSTGLSPTKEEQMYLEEAAQRLENIKEDNHDQDSGRG